MKYPSKFSFLIRIEERKMVAEKIISAFSYSFFIIFVRFNDMLGENVKNLGPAAKPMY